MAEPFRVPDVDASGLFTLTGRYVLDGVEHIQEARYRGNPWTNPDAVLVSGPDLRNGMRIYQNSGTPDLIASAEVDSA